jgi:hypothetical protein
MNVVFYPTSQVSFGVLSEMVHAHTTGKKVYILYPFRSISPFLEYYATAVRNPGANDRDPRTPEEIESFMANAADAFLGGLLREHGAA